MSAVYRVRQFARAAGAWVWRTEVDVDLVAGYLTPAALDLFRAMPRYDRQHGLAVFYMLQAQGHDEADLLAAALLHDAGKTADAGGGVRLWHRVVTVLMRAFAPGVLERLGQDRPGSWRRPFFVQQQHAAIGAELARAAGCSVRTVDIIRCHEDPPGVGDDALLAALRAADEVN